MLVSNPKEFKRVELLHYTHSNSEKLIGLAVELAEDPSGGIQVRVLKDSNLVSCILVVPLKACAVATSQKCNCCE